MSLSVTRTRRPDAGSKMSKLLNEEEEDEFYTSTYGGFNEEADDVDYESESSVADSIDSDFAASENESEDSHGGSDDELKRKRPSRRVVTKSYKEPKRRNIESIADDSTEAETQSARKPRSDTPQPEMSGRNKDIVVESRQLRDRSHHVKSTTTPSESTALRRKAVLAEIAQRKNVSEVRRLTQEELLAEAKITEEINKRSLARYQRLEVERKKVRVHKAVTPRSMIRIHHFAVPSIEDQPEVYGAAVNTATGDVELKQILVDRGSKCSRTLVTFTDPSSFAAIFPTAAKQAITGNIVRPWRRTRYCPLTGKVARYMDPLTRTPYADLPAFRALRYLYQIHLETGTPAIDLLRQYRSNQLRIPEV